jgi:hypothetical protein
LGCRAGARHGGCFPGPWAAAGRGAGAPAPINRGLCSEWHPPRPLSIHYCPERAGAAPGHGTAGTANDSEERQDRPVRPVRGQASQLRPARNQTRQDQLKLTGSKTDPDTHPWEAGLPTRAEANLPDFAPARRPTRGHTAKRHWRYRTLFLRDHRESRAPGSQAPGRGMDQADRAIDPDSCGLWPHPQGVLDSRRCFPRG